MKIDSKKLAKLIKASLETIKQPVSIASGVVIGEIDGAQIQLNVTRDEDGYWETRKSNFCVSA